ncbi:MAG: M20 family metallo-hydrolase [Pirellulaceae bacterium]|nr:M20 family metallo-hydrolase [Pirellulaceae bacterium]
MNAQRWNVDGQRLNRELLQLATFSDVSPPAVTRVVFSQADQAARQYLLELFQTCDLQVRIDAVGNIFARWVGSQPALPAVGTGSHCDAIPHSGRFDGTVGVLGGLEAIRALKSAGFEPKRSIELVMFTAEEPTRYGLGCLGSRLMAGVLPPERASRLTDDQGHTLEATRTAFGLEGALSSVRLATDYFAHWIELHIEQGPLLEQQQIPIGIVQAIAAPAALRCSFIGQGGHAGTVLMADRKDAFLGAAALALAVQQHALELGSVDTVATTGYVKVHPCAVNSIPAQVDLEIDVRDVDAARRNRVLEAIHSSAKSIAAERGLQVLLEVINADPPARSSATIASAIRHACQELGLDYLEMTSRAYHDTLFMAVIAPVAMVFIPCYRGYSHRPDEFVALDALECGVKVLAHTLATLSSDLEAPA